MIRFALIGTGVIAEKHAQSIQSSKDAQLVAIRSSDKTRAEQLAKKFNIPKVFTDYEALLKDPEIDAVDIVTTNNQHADLGIKAAKAKKHVLVEKPIDISVKKAEHLIQECKKNNVTLSVISQHRFDEAILQVKDLLQKGALGKPILGHCSIKWARNKDYYEASAGWRKTKEQAGGGVLIMQTIHHLDLLQSLLGEVTSVHGMTTNLKHNLEVEDTAVALLKFKNGAIATLEGTTSLPYSLNDRLEIHGDKGSVVLKKRGFLHRIAVLTAPLSKLQKLKLKFSTYKTGTIKDQIEDFIQAIQEKRQPKVTGEDGLNALKTILAIYESENLKNEVPLR